MISIGVYFLIFLGKQHLTAVVYTFQPFMHVSYITQSLCDLCSSMESYANTFCITQPPTKKTKKIIAKTHPWDKKESKNAAK